VEYSLVRGQKFVPDGLERRKWYGCFKSNAVPAYIAVMISLMGCNTDKIDQLEKQNRELTAKLEATSRQEPLSLKISCAKQALAEFERGGWNKLATPRHMASLTNHYNSKLGKCFMEIEDTDFTAIAHGTAINKIVSDAFEGKVYGEYVWFSDKKKKYWEVTPFLCKITPLSGEPSYCKSTEEFDTSVRQFMEQ